MTIVRVPGESARSRSASISEVITLRPKRGLSFRSTFSTLANESGKWSVNAIEAALAHVEPNAVRRAYARGDYWDERVKLMTWWADHLDTLRNGGRVLQFKGASA